jgi:hypothetical protein
MRDTNGKNADKAKALSEVENVKILDVSLTMTPVLKMLLTPLYLPKEGLMFW